MRAAAGVLDGLVTVDSQPGEGTTVVARLGAPPEDPDDAGRARPAGPPPRLRLVPPLPTASDR
jgi:hypothetical protein